jgi:hypothetical protein
LAETLLNSFTPSNAFCKVDAAKPLQVGDVCKAEARIVSAIKVNEGKIANVKGHIYREGKKVIDVVEVVSSFLYRGRFVDCKSPFHSHQLMLHQLRLSLCHSSICWRKEPPRPHHWVSLAACITMVF